MQDDLGRFDSRGEKPDPSRKALEYHVTMRESGKSTRTELPDVESSNLIIVRRRLLALGNLYKVHPRSGDHGWCPKSH